MEDIICDDIYVGIDPSLTESGLMLLNQDAIIMKGSLITSSSKDVIEKRYSDIMNELRFIHEIHGLKVVYIEGLSLYSKGASVMELAGLHYIIRKYFYDHNVSFKVIPPNSLKKWVVKGQIKKNLMLLYTYKRWGIEFDNDNKCDAYCLARMALEEERVKLEHE